MEILITLAIVATAAAFLGVRWVRSARRALSTPTSGACGGGCAGCTVPHELRKLAESNASPVCDAHRDPDAPRAGGR
jgi:hypothetical protein